MWVTCRIVTPRFLATWDGAGARNGRRNDDDGSRREIARSVHLQTLESGHCDRREDCDTSPLRNAVKQKVRIIRQKFIRGQPDRSRRFEPREAGVSMWWWSIAIAR